MASAAARPQRSNFLQLRQRGVVRSLLRLASRLPALQATTPNRIQRSNKMIKRFFRDETGLELSEYAVAAALVALAAVLAFQTLGGNISSKINDLAGKIK